MAVAKTGIYSPDMDKNALNNVMSSRPTGKTCTQQQVRKMNIYFFVITNFIQA